jgi:hypothetical protein
MPGLCAWCPVFDPRDPANHGASHGICPACAAKLRASLDPNPDPTTPPDIRSPEGRPMRRPVMLALTLALLSRPAAAQSLGPSLALLAGSGADLATTLHALHTIPGAREGNPLLSHGGDAGFI